MRKQAKILSALLMILMISSFAAAVQKPAAQQTGTPAQVVDIGQDVITASDAGGGYLSTRDIILVVNIIFAVIGLIYVL